MKTIFKFPLGHGDNCLSLPKGSVPLSFEVQYGVPTMWVLVDTDVQIPENRTFRFYGAGHQIDVGVVRFVGTALPNDGSLVWHLFEIVK